MSGHDIQLIVGLGNPGRKYERTRHNAGFWLVDALAQQFGESFSRQEKFFGDLCRIRCAGTDVWLLKPQTFMNESGRSVRAVSQFYKIAAAQILVAYDEIDLLPGKAKLKQGGGHGGHNGMRDLIAQVSADFLRLRIGVGHPGDKAQVVNYVLGEPSKKEAQLIDSAIDEGARIIPVLLEHGLQKATHELHSQQSDVTEKPKPAKTGAKRTEKTDQTRVNARRQVRPEKIPKFEKTAKPSRRNDDDEKPAVSKRASLKDQLFALLKKK